MNPLLLLNVSKLNPRMFWFLSQMYPVHRVIVSLETFPLCFVIIMIIIITIIIFCVFFLSIQDLIGLQSSTLFQAVQRILMH